MLWPLFFVLYGDVIFALLAALSATFRSNTDSQIDSDDSRFFENADFMFPENFLSRYPHEDNPYRLKIYAYLIFNLFVKGYGSVDPGRFYADYNRDDYKRVLIDAVFYEYFTNFTDREDKDLVFDPLKRILGSFPMPVDVVLHPPKSNLPMSIEEMAVDRIGQYLDILAENKTQKEELKGAYEFLPETENSAITVELETNECETHPLIQTSGILGIDYPNFCVIPETSFSCDHRRKPGIYADYETGCQAFHVCWPHRIDSFLCPIGTMFNQSLLTCDIWHDTKCYSSRRFVNNNQFVVDGIDTKMDIPSYNGSCESLLNKPLRRHAKFLPAKCEVKYLEENKPVDDTDELATRILTTFERFIKMLETLRERRDGLTNEMTSRVIPWTRLLEKRLETRSTPKKVEDETTEVTKKVGKIYFKSPKRTKPRVLSAGKLSLGKFNFHGSHIKPSISHSKKLKKSYTQVIPEIKKKSLILGGNVFKEGLPLSKQVIIDSYRKIKSKKL